MADVDIKPMTPENISRYGVCGYKNVEKHEELRNKIQWYKENYPKGLRIMALISKKDGYQGMIEYITGEYAYRPVDAKGYMFIHCLFVGFKKEYKEQGYASSLIGECIKEARAAGLNGVAVVTRKGPFMAGDKIFLKNGFHLIDSTEPDFDLLALKFNDFVQDPKFKIMDGLLSTDFSKGLTIIRSVQCPYTLKNVKAIVETAEREYGIGVRLIDIKDATQAQMSPCAFGTFCLIHDGEVLSYHPISKARFKNIMKKRLG